MAASSLSFSVLSTSCLKVLQLRGCAITDAVLQPLAKALSDDTSLQQLDLSHNHLSDEGAQQLANALRLNRSLLSLALTNNRIGDAGVKKLAGVREDTPTQARSNCISSTMSSGAEEVCPVA